MEDKIILVDWEKKLNGILSSILPTKPKGEKKGIANCAAFHYKVSKFQRQKDSFQAIVHIRAVDRAEDTVRIISGQQVVDEISSHTKLKFTSRKENSWNSRAKQMLIEMHAQTFDCSKPGCETRIRTVCWTNNNPRKSACKRKPRIMCANCHRGGHKANCCCYEIGICRVFINWQHNHLF